MAKMLLICNFDVHDSLEFQNTSVSHQSKKWLILCIFWIVQKSIFDTNKSGAVRGSSIQSLFPSTMNVGKLEVFFFYRDS